MKAFPQEVWRVNPDGELRDHFRKLKYVFQTEEEWFFRHYASMDVPAKAKNTFLEECRTEIETTRAKINVDAIPFRISGWQANYRESCRTNQFSMSVS